MQASVSGCVGHLSDEQQHPEPNVLGVYTFARMRRSTRIRLVSAQTSRMTKSTLPCSPLCGLEMICHSSTLLLMFSMAALSFSSSCLFSLSSSSPASSCSLSSSCSEALQCPICHCSPYNRRCVTSRCAACKACLARPTHCGRRHDAGQQR